MSANIGKITQVIGPVVDVTFENTSDLPRLLDALTVDLNGTQIVLEVQKHTGDDTVRTVAMETTDGLSRGLEVVNTGAPIIMPVGEQIKGRLFNVVGDSIDGIGAVDKTGGYSIHRQAPKFEDLSTCE